MGGNALKSQNIEARRISTPEMRQFILEMQTLAVPHFNWLDPVKCWHNKPTHGDIDFIGFAKSDRKGKQLPAWAEEIMEQANSEGFHWNKPVLSFEYKGVQIDFAVKYTDRDAKNYLNFCQYSPTGNIVGRMLKQTGVKWGVDGLTFPVRDPADDNNMLGSVDLTDNVEDILSLAGLDPKKWVAGFDQETEIYEYACNSPLFNKEIFQFENLNHVNRKRDRYIVCN